MEEFRLHVRHQPHAGNIWELRLIPEIGPLFAGVYSPIQGARLLGSASSPVSIAWLREVARPYVQRLDPPYDIDQLGPRSEGVTLLHEDGMRLALAFSAAHYLVTPRQRQHFREGLAELPAEALLYWFTLCFYGNRTSAGKDALRTLLAYEEPPPPRRPARAKKASRPSQPAADPVAPTLPGVGDP